VHIELAFDTRGHGREDDPCLTFEPLSATVNKRLDSVWVILCVLSDRHKHGVDPSSGLNRVQTAYNELKLLVEGIVKVLNGDVVGCDANASDTTLDEASGDFGFVGSDIRLTEEKLAVQIGNVNCVC
jgi:hypothetical protein